MRIINLALVMCFILQQTCLAQAVTPVPVAVDVYRPVQLRQVSYYPDRDTFDFQFSKGNEGELAQEEMSRVTKLLMNYFLVGMSLKNDAFWVNLRMGSPNEVIDPALERTELGRVLLEADVRLKKDLAKMTDPATAEGRLYWNKLYEKAQALSGSENMAIPTAVRPWIVPGQIIIGEDATGAYIYKAQLEVRLERDHLPGAASYEGGEDQLRVLNDYAAELVKKYFIPRLTRRVNSSRAYAGLRQVYYSLVLAQWFKEKFRGSGTVSSRRIDSGDLSGLPALSGWSKDIYYQEYCRSLKEGEYSRTEHFKDNEGLVERVYISGGFVGKINNAYTVVKNKLDEMIDKGNVFTLSDINIADDLKEKTEHLISLEVKPEHAAIVARAMQMAKHLDSGNAGLLVSDMQALETMSNDELQQVIEDGRPNRASETEILYKEVGHGDTPSDLLSKERAYNTRYKEQASVVLEDRNKVLKQRIADALASLKEMAGEKKLSVAAAVDMVKAAADLLGSIKAGEFVAFVERVGRENVDAAFSDNLRDAVEAVSRMKEPGSTLTDLVREFPVDLSKIDVSKLENLRMLMNTLIQYRDAVRPELPYLKDAKIMVEAELADMQDSLPYVYDGEKAMFVIYAAGLLKEEFSDAEVRLRVSSYIEDYYAPYAGQPLLTVGMEIEVHTGMLGRDNPEIVEKEIPFIRGVAEQLQDYLYFAPRDDGLIEFAVGPSRSVECQVAQLLYLRKLGLVPDNGMFPVHITIGFPQDLSSGAEISYKTERDYIFFANALAMAYTPDERFTGDMFIHNAFSPVTKFYPARYGRASNDQASLEIRHPMYLSLGSWADEAEAGQFKRLLGVIETFRYVLAGRLYEDTLGVQADWAKELMPIWSSFKSDLSDLLDEYGIDLKFFQDVDQQYQWGWPHAQRNNQAQSLGKLKDDNEFVLKLQALMENTSEQIRQKMPEEIFRREDALDSLVFQSQQESSGKPASLIAAAEQQMSGSFDSISHPTLKLMYTLNELSLKVSRLRQALTRYAGSRQGDDKTQGKNDGGTVGGVDFRVFKPVEIKAEDSGAVLTGEANIPVPADPAAALKQIQKQLEQRIVPDMTTIRGCLLACKQSPDPLQARAELKKYLSQAMLLQEEQAVETPLEMISLL